MARDDDEPPDVEFLDVGPEPRPSGVGRPTKGHLRRWLAPLSVLVVAVGLIGVLVHDGRRPPAVPAAPHPAPATVPSSGTSSATSEPPVTVTRISHPLLGVLAGWEIFGRGDRAVIRVQLAAGRITRTTVPALQSTGPVSFVIGASQALIRPIDFVPGYVVPDGRPAVRPPPGLAVGPAFPGPDPGHVWVPSTTTPGTRMILVAFDGSASGQSIPIPAGGNALSATPDGGGYLLFPGTGGIYDSRPGALRRVTTGALLAAGPSGWLVTECDDADRCTAVVVDRRTGTRRTIGPAPANTAWPGVISPDGTTAAFSTVDTASGQLTSDLLSIPSGTRHAIDPVVDHIDQSTGTAVWSPDSRWLLTLGQDGTLDAVDAQTGRARLLDASLPNLDQLGVRAGPS